MRNPNMNLHVICNLPCMSFLCGAFLTKGNSEHFKMFNTIEWLHLKQANLLTAI